MYNVNIWTVIHWRICKTSVKTSVKHNSILLLGYIKHSLKKNKGCFHSYTCMHYKNLSTQRFNFTFDFCKFSYLYSKHCKFLHNILCLLTYLDLYTTLYQVIYASLKNTKKVAHGKTHYERWSESSWTV